MTYSSLVSVISCLFLILVLSNTEVPPFFIFGDSLVDVGNNNYIDTLAKADTEPNGIDFAPADGRPTGRFCNGKTVLDFVGDESRSTCYPRPNLSPDSVEFAATCGLNYGSAGAGILNKTGYFIGRINMDEQIDNFDSTRNQQISILGMYKAMEMIKRSLFLVVMGSNDFLVNYLVPIISEGNRKLVPPEVFIQQVITRFKFQLQRLHRLGARKIGVFSIGPIGCIPYQRELNSLTGKGCLADSNQLVISFNTKLKDLIMELNSKFPEAKLIYCDSYNVVTDIIQNSAQYGFEVTDSGCCKLAGQYGVPIPCGTITPYCEDREKYFFWDAFHPSQAANKLIAKRFFDGGDEDTYPINLRKLLQ